MKTHPIMVFALSAVLVASIGMVPHAASGQSATDGPLTVATDMASYTDGDTVMVMGTVDMAYSGIQVSIIVTSPNGNIVTIDQLPVGADNTYSTTVATGGGLIKESGTYTIEATYGKDTAMTSFEMTVSGSGTTVPGSDPGSSPGQPAEYRNSVLEPSDVPITYSIAGGSLLSIEPDVDAKSLIIMIDATDDGSLTITVPRTILESTDAAGDDADVFVLVDDEEANGVEITATATDRTITIPFSAGDGKIEIVGTWVIPEFGMIAAMILAIAIISIVAVSARSRLGIMMPRY